MKTVLSTLQFLVLLYNIFVLSKILCQNHCFVCGYVLTLSIRCYCKFVVVKHQSIIQESQSNTKLNNCFISHHKTCLLIEGQVVYKYLLPFWTTKNHLKFQNRKCYNHNFCLLTDVIYVLFKSPRGLHELDTTSGCRYQRSQNRNPHKKDKMAIQGGHCAISWRCTDRRQNT